jgi:hypothetical protein
MRSRAVVPEAAGTDLWRAEAVFRQGAEEIASGGCHGFEDEFPQPAVEPGRAVRHFQLPLGIRPAPEQLERVQAPGF